MAGAARPEAPSDLALLLESSEARAYADMLRSSGAGFAVYEPGNGMVALSSSALQGSIIVNRVLGLGVCGVAVERQLDTLISRYASAGLGFGIELAPAAQPPELVGWMKARRLRRALRGKAMLWRDGSPPPPRYEKWARATRLRVERIGSEWAESLARLCCANFGMPPATMPLLVAGTAGPRWRRWIAFDGEQPVGGSLSYVEGEVTWLGWTSVLPSHRGRFVHAGIVARELEDAAASGCRWVTTETAPSTREQPDAAYHNLCQFGFQEAYLRQTWLRAAPLKREAP